MERIVRGRSATLTKTFTFTPTGTPTVALARVSTGAAVTTGAVSGSGTTWTYTIPASSNTLLDTYEETWTAVTGGEPQAFDDNTIEVTGASFFTLAEFRAFAGGTYTDAEIVEMRTTVEQALEDELAFACVPRYTLKTISGPGGPTLLLSPYTTAIRSVTVDGTALSAPDLAALTYGLTGTVHRASGWWSCGVNNIVVGYEHGLTSPPGGCDRVAKLLAKTWLVGQRSPIDDRAMTFSAENGVSYSLAVPGRNGSIFGIPDVDAWIAGKTLKVGIA